jgi:pimeloyl-ACP methyl ester carboxylesterase
VSADPADRPDHLSLTVPTARWGALTFDALAAGPVDGEGVLLLHGFPQTARCWRRQIEVLADAGFRAVAPDQRGYSPGARPDAVEAYDTLELTADVVGLADVLGWDRFHLVGHDWGGSIAWQVAGRHGDRLRTLMVVSTPHPRAFAEALRGPDGDQAQRSGYIELFRADGAEQLILADDAAGLRLIYGASGMSEAEAAPYLDAFADPARLAAALRWYRAAHLTMLDGLGPVTVPTLYVWSTEDPALGPAAATATGACVDGPYRFEVLEGVSHWVPEHAADRLGELLLAHLRGRGPVRSR